MNNKTATITDLAKLFSLNKSAVNYWVKAGLLTPIGLKGKVTKLFDRQESSKKIKIILKKPDTLELKDLV